MVFHMLCNVIYAPRPPSHGPFCYWPAPASNFLIGQAFSLPHFSSKNVRIEVSEFTHRIKLYWLLDFETVAIVIQHNAVWNLLNILNLISYIYLTTVVLLQKMILGFLVCGSCSKYSKCIADNRLWIEIIFMVFHVAQTLHYNNE